MVRWVDETGSTNVDLLAEGRNGAPEQVRITDYQSAGRGRRDRRWLAPPGSALMMSVLVRKGIVIERMFRITMAMGLAALDAIEVAGGVRAGLKWPNDVVIDDKKLAGVLAESSLSDRPLVVVGIGLNVSPEAIRGLPAEISATATCLGEHTTVDSGTRAELAVELLRSLPRWLDASESELVVGYRERLDTIGRQVVVTSDDGTIVEGVATGVSTRGELIVHSNGADHTFAVGDVSHVRARRDQTEPQ